MFGWEEPQGWACECGSPAVVFRYKLEAVLTFGDDGRTKSLGGVVCEATPERCARCNESDKLYQFREMNKEEKERDIVRLTYTKPDDDGTLRL